MFTIFAYLDHARHLRQNLVVISQYLADMRLRLTGTAYVPEAQGAVAPMDVEPFSDEDVPQRLSDERRRSADLLRQIDADMEALREFCGFEVPETKSTAQKAPARP